MAANINMENIQNIPHNLIVKLKALYDSLKTAEKKAADLLLRNPAFFAAASIVDAAKAANCSEATMVRLARKLGYNGFPELKAALNQAGEKSSVDLYEGINEKDDCNTITNKVFCATIQALEDTLNILDMNEYQKAVDKICNANKLLLCGVGDAASVAKSGYQKFLRIGMNVQASPDIDVQLISASHLGKGDVLIAISHSGRTKSILDVVKYARTSGATIISITNFPTAPLAKNSDIVLLTAAFSEHVKGEVISKRVSELCIIESLYINVLMRKKEILAENLSRSNAALEINKV